MTLSNYLNADFIGRMMSEFKRENIKVLSLTPFDLDNSASILVSLSAGMSERPIGHFGIRLNYEIQGKIMERDCVLKVKPHGNEIVEMLNSLAAFSGEPLASVYLKFKSETGFKNVHMRELEVYKKLQPEYAQEILGVYADEEHQLYFILMENLVGTQLLNSVMEVDQWTDQHIKWVLDGMAQWHAKAPEVAPKLSKQYWDDQENKTYMLRLKPLWEALNNQAADKFPDLYSAPRKQLMQGFIDDLPNYWSELENMPMTLVHNDCNPRNICFRNVNSTNPLCLYDWELATFHVPAYDVVEFLSFVLDVNRYSLRKSYLDYYYHQLKEYSNMYPSQKIFYRSFKLAARDFGLHRLGMYMMAHAVSPYPFLPRVINSYFDTLTMEL